MPVIRWVCESSVFGPAYALPAAARADGHVVNLWDDAWWQAGAWPKGAGEQVVFHGSLGNAARIVRDLPWLPGAYCNTDAFRCSTWYPRAAKWLVHKDWSVLPAQDLVARPPGDVEAVFVRPDSPLKPFSGRVLRTDRITLASLDHGFYYEDPALPVVVAPVRHIAQEWRYVVVDREIIAGSAYVADGRAALADDPRGRPWQYAASVAAALEPPEAVYVMDVCEADNELRLLELNPFSGADLYGCDPTEVVRAVSEAALREGR